MNKLKQTFKLNPLYEADGYKVGHHSMLAPNVSREGWNWIPRSLKNMHPSIKKLMSAGQQLTWRYIHSAFQEFFFNKPIEVAEKFAKDMSKYLMIEYNGDHFKQLHNLGYLPVDVKSLTEGVFTQPNIPHMTGINTVDGYSWLGLFLETLVSKLAWQMPTAATIGAKFKENAVEWVTKTDSKNLWFADFMCHDFHSRGGNPYTSIAVGLGHAICNSGSDTLNVIPASRYYYDFDEEEVPIFSVNASEHSVSCTNIFYYERKLKQGLLDESIKEYYSFDAPCEGSIENPDYLTIAEWLMLRDWLKKFPKGILSYVCDTMNTWKSCTHIIPRLKKEILEREGKLVLRPDSGDPVDIICGFEAVEMRNKWIRISNNDTTTQIESKGVAELLWDIFGGTVSDEGYKVLDSHIGAIYGDSINLERQVAMYSRLADKGFAATNIVLGIGSYTYVMLTRDSAGFAAKGCWFETFVEGVREEYDIYKDPITDNGTKKSLKGFQFISLVDGEYICESGVSEEKYNSEENELKTIYRNGEFFNQTTLIKIKQQVNETYKKQLVAL